MTVRREMAEWRATSAKTGWSLLFIWSVSFVWLNQTDQIDQMNQINPRPSRPSRQFSLALIIVPQPASPYQNDCP